MSKLIKLSNRATSTFEAPNWVADAIDGSSHAGEGSYARVYICKDGSALKITKDKATIRLIKHLIQNPWDGFPPISRASPLRINKDTLLAVSMQQLYPLPRSGWRARSIRTMYNQALLATCKKFGFETERVQDARRFTRNFTATRIEPCTDFSSQLCRELASQCLHNPSGRHLRKSLLNLASFCEIFQCDIDLISTDNWMINLEGHLFLSDPVVHKAYIF